MCDCIKNIQKEILEKYPIWEGKKVVSYTHDNWGICFDTGKVTYNIGFDIKFENQKKQGHTSMPYTYCPHCGKKVE